MSDLLVAAFATLDRPVDPRPDFTEALWLSIEQQLHGQAQHTEPSSRVRVGRGRRPAWPVLVPAATVAALVAVLLGVLTSVRPQHADALSVITTARARFASLPPIHVVYTAQNETDHPQLATTSTYDVWYADATHWRSAVIASTRPEHTGEFQVADGTYAATYTNNPAVFSVRRVGDPPVGAPVADFSPDTVWAQAGRHGISPTAWFRSGCNANSVTFRGRAAFRLDCDGGRVQVWVDRETGILLKTIETPSVREVTRIEIGPTFASHLFDLTPPAGAFVTWSGSQPTPAPYAARPGHAVDRTVPLRGVWPQAMAATDTAVWVAAVASNRPNAPTLLQRIDATTGRITAVVREPAGLWQLTYGQGTLWAGMTNGARGPGPSLLFDLDPTTGRGLTRPMTVEPTGGDGMNTLTTLGHDVWWSTGFGPQPGTGGVTRSRQRLARIDLAARHVTMFDLPGSASTVIPGFGSLWVAQSQFLPPDRTVESVVRVDPGTGRVTKRFPLPARDGPTGIAIGDRYAYLGWFVSETERVLTAVDPETNRVVTERSVIGKPIWAAGELLVVDGMHDVVQRLDPDTLRTIARLHVGHSPAWAATTAGYAWVLNAQDMTLSRINLAALR